MNSLCHYLLHCKQSIPLKSAFQQIRFDKYWNGKKKKRSQRLGNIFDVTSAKSRITFEATIEWLKVQCLVASEKWSESNRCFIVCGDLVSFVSEKRKIQIQAKLRIYSFTVITILSDVLRHLKTLTWSTVCSVKRWHAGTVCNSINHHACATICTGKTSPTS